jgi:hypothetical protein
MKKLMFAFLIACFAIVVTSCADNSPEGVVTKAAKFLQEKDYKAYVDLFQFKDESDAEKVKEKKAGIVQMLTEKAEKKPEDMTFKSFEIVEKEIGENSAKFKVKFIRENGTEKIQSMDLIKNDDGKWKLDAGK